MQTCVPLLVLLAVVSDDVEIATEEAKNKMYNEINKFKLNQVVKDVI